MILDFDHCPLCKSDFCCGQFLFQLDVIICLLHIKAKIIDNHKKQPSVQPTMENNRETKKCCSTSISSRMCRFARYLLHAEILLFSPTYQIQHLYSRSQLEEKLPLFSLSVESAHTNLMLIHQQLNHLDHQI